MQTPQEQPVDATRRAWASPPPRGAADLKVFTDRRRSTPRPDRPARRGAPGVRLFLGTAAITSVLLGAAVLRGPTELRLENLRLEQQVRSARRALSARQGELELVRLELNRMNSIIEHSRRHAIPTDLAMAIYDIAMAERIDPALAFSLVRVESGFTRRAVSSAGAVGFTQVMPSTAFWLQPGLSYTDLFERDTNLRLGFRYLRMLLEQYQGDLQLALLAYNRGPGRVDDILRAGGNPSNGYEHNVRRGSLRPRGD